MSIRGSAMVRPEVLEREDGALQVRAAVCDSCSVDRTFTLKLVKL